MASPVLQGCLQKLSNLCMLISESWGVLAWGHIDGSSLVASNCHNCENVVATVDLFTNLGFTIHPGKIDIETYSRN